MSCDFPLGKLWKTILFRNAPRAVFYLTFWCRGRNGQAAHHPTDGEQRIACRAWMNMPYVIVPRLSLTEINVAASVHASFILFENRLDLAIRCIGWRRDLVLDYQFTDNR